MVEVAWNLEVVSQDATKLLAVLARHTVDDAALVAEPGAHQLRHICFDGVYRFLMPDFIEKVWPVKTTLKTHHILIYSQSLDNIILDLDGGGSCQAQEWNFWITSFQLVKMKIILPKILTPMGHAVNFINYKPINSISRIQKIQAVCQSIRINEFFWRQIHNFIL